MRVVPQRVLVVCPACDAVRMNPLETEMPESPPYWVRTRNERHGPYKSAYDASRFLMGQFEGWVEDKHGDAIITWDYLGADEGSQH